MSPGPAGKKISGTPNPLMPGYRFSNPGQHIREVPGAPGPAGVGRAALAVRDAAAVIRPSARISAGTGAASASSSRSGRDRFRLPWPPYRSKLWEIPVRPGLLEHQEPRRVARAAAAARRRLVPSGWLESPPGAAARLPGIGRSVSATDRRAHRASAFSLLATGVEPTAEGPGSGPVRWPAVSSADRRGATRPGPRRSPAISAARPAHGRTPTAFPPGTAAGQLLRVASQRAARSPTLSRWPTGSASLYDKTAADKRPAHEHRQERHRRDRPARRHAPARGDSPRMSSACTTTSPRCWLAWRIWRRS